MYNKTTLYLVSADILWAGARGDYPGEDDSQVVSGIAHGRRPRGKRHWQNKQSQTIQKNKLTWVKF